MASIRTDSEFFTNMIAGKPAPVFKPGPSGQPFNAVRQFVTVMDENYWPMVIGLSNDEHPKLEIIRHNAQDIQHISDLGTCFDIPHKSSIQAFAATQVDPYNESHIYIGTKGGIYHHSPQNIKRGYFPDLLCEDEHVQGCRYMEGTSFNSGDYTPMTIWFTSKENEFGYIRVDLAMGPYEHKPILLLPANDATYAAPMTVGPTGEGEFARPPFTTTWQSVIIADNDGNLSHLRQASGHGQMVGDRDYTSGQWHEMPFYIHHDEGLYEIESYSITIKPLSENGSPLVKSSVQISASSSMTGYLNGKNATFSPTAQWYATDFEGTLNFIIPTTSMACPILTVTELRDSHGKTVPISEADLSPLDPSKKVVNQLHENIAGIQSVTDLKSLRTQSGESLFDPTDMPTDADLEAGLGQLKLLKDVHGNLPPNGSIKVGYTVPGTAISPPEGLLHDIVDAWHYVTKKVHEAEEWVVKAAEDTIHFICKIAGKVYQFVLDTVEKVVKAATWIWTKIKVGLKALIDFVGFLFNWDDIIATKNQVSALITSGIDLTADKIGLVEDKVKEMLDNVVNNIRGVDLDKDIKASSGKDGSERSLETLLHTTADSWMGERLKNGGMMGLSPLEDNLDLTPDGMARAWWKEASEPFANIRGDLTTHANLIKECWAKFRKFLDCMGLLYDGISTINSFPSDPDLPSLKLRQAMSCVSVFKSGAHFLATFVPGEQEEGNNTKDEIMLGFDLMITIVDFGLHQAAGAIEIVEGENGRWDQYHRDSTVEGMVGSLWKLVAGASYFVAQTNPEDVDVSVPCLMIFQAATEGLI
ncbi:hypothetical protein BDW59DRAFT_165860 [Aspergillus cavernicola]|uniref:Uncharacterized protein n=1 Tax=Aspergillus cavernicola TaxID=176166 RepID=A0ABR4HQE3_9EURO